MVCDDAELNCTLRRPGDRIRDFSSLVSSVVEVLGHNISVVFVDAPRLAVYLARFG